MDVRYLWTWITKKNVNNVKKKTKETSKKNISEETFHKIGH